MPFGEFSEALKLPTVGVSLVNHDNPISTGRTKTCGCGTWEAMDRLASIVTMSRPTRA